MAITIDQRVDVNVTLGIAPIAQASFDSALFLADLTDANFPDALRVYTSYTGVLADFAETTDVAKFASKAFAGNHRPSKLTVVKYGAANATPLTPLQAITAAQAINDDFFYVAADVADLSTVVSLVTYCEDQYKMFVNVTQDSSVLDIAENTDIGSVLQDAAYNQVITLYKGDAFAELPHAGIIGAMAGIEAGVSTLEDKTLVGVTTDNLTETQRTALEAKNVAYYAKIAGVNSVFNSKVASGQFLDTIIFSNWLRARLGEAIYGKMKAESDAGRKISYDSAGKLKIQQAIWSVLNRGLANGSISNDVPPVVRIPTNAEIADADRAARTLPDVVVEVVYSNAVHKVKVRAYVSV